MNYTLEHMCSLFFPQAGAPLFVGPGIKTGINLRYDNPRSLGSDRICNAVGAYRIYGGPVITIDFGTATTFGVVDDHANFLGGAICPGVQVSLGALIEKTSMLPKIELIKPASVIGKNAVHCIQSGIVYGYVGQVDYFDLQDHRRDRPQGHQAHRHRRHVPPDLVGIHLQHHHQQHPHARGPQLPLRNEPLTP